MGSSWTAEWIHQTG